MNETIIGVLLSIVVSILYSLYIIPRKFSKQSTYHYTLVLGFSFFVCMAVFYAVMALTDNVAEELFSWWHVLSALRGVSWMIGSLLLNAAIAKAGISKTNQWKNMQLPLGSLLMLLFLGDVVGLKIIYLVIGIIFMLISAMLFSIKKQEVNRQEISKGISLAILSAIFFGTNAFLQKLLVNQGFVFSQALYLALFVFLSAFVVYLIKFKTLKPIFVKTKQTFLPAIAGFAFAIASVLNVLAVSKIAGSISFAIVQLNAVWTILIGVFFFKEIKFKQNWLRLVGGLLCAISAVVVLMFAL